MTKVVNITDPCLCWSWKEFIVIIAKWIFAIHIRFWKFDHFIVFDFSRRRILIDPIIVYTVKVKN